MSANYCPDCGSEVRASDSFCRDCGAAVDDQSGPETVDAEVVDTDWNGSPSASRDRETMFYVGAVLAVAGVIVAPYVFVFVALPETILSFWGKSIQDSLPGDARNNPFVSGSFLILRWFGNFLLLVIILGVVAVLFLVAA